MKLKFPKSFFFWKKSGKGDAVKAEEMLQMYIKYLPQLRKAMKQVQDEEEASDLRGNFLKRMYDFWDAFGNDVGVTENHYDQKQLPDGRIAKKPKEVVEELERVPVEIDFKNIDQKINVFHTKRKLIGHKFTREQVEGFIQRLHNRKHYQYHKEFFDLFPYTTDAKIDKLLKTYTLVMKSSDLFIPTFPKAAIDIMEKYSDVVAKFTDEAPVFYVIAEKEDFEKKYDKLDPILLVQSPFGFTWQILGAWDKEMLLLSEL